MGENQTKKGPLLYQTLKVSQVFEFSIFFLDKLKQNFGEIQQRKANKNHFFKTVKIRLFDRP